MLQNIELKNIKWKEMINININNKKSFHYGNNEMIKYHDYINHVTILLYHGKSKNQITKL